MTLTYSADLNDSDRALLYACMARFPTDFYGQPWGTPPRVGSPNLPRFEVRHSGRFLEARPDFAEWTNHAFLMIEAPHA